MTTRKKKSLLKRIIFPTLLIIAIIGGYKAYDYYKMIFNPNVSITENNEFIYIPTGSSFPEVAEILSQKQIIKDKKSFILVATKKNYPNHVYPGKYKLKDNMSNNELVNLLRSGNQTPVKITFNNIRTKEELAGIVGKAIETDSSELIKYFNSKKTAAKYGFTPEAFPVLFIPNTYEFFWNTSAEEFVERMAKEYKKFWTPERIQKAKNIGLSQSQVSILASIVEQETKKNDEKPIVAGVYLNRLKRNIPLQADPTIVFALGDFSIRRILKKHLKIKSPYNTYINRGLPPGPICFPDIYSIKSVLNFKKHDYIYFCAKEDFSGYHNFAKTLYQHNRNARKYQRALNKKRIYK